MLARTHSLQIIVVAGLVLVSLEGCARRTVTVGRATGEAKSGTRVVKFSLDGNGGIVGLQDRATVTFAGGKVIVEKDAFCWMTTRLRSCPATPRSWKSITPAAR